MLISMRCSRLRSQSEAREGATEASDSEDVRITATKWCPSTCGRARIFSVATAAASGYVARTRASSGATREGAPVLCRSCSVSWPST